MERHRVPRRTALAGLVATTLLVCAISPAIAAERPLTAPDGRHREPIRHPIGPVRLHTLAPGPSAATHVSPDGHYVVGVATGSDGEQHAMLWHHGRPRDLGFDLAPYAVNNQGRIIGV